MTDSIMMDEATPFGESDRERETNFFQELFVELKQDLSPLEEDTQEQVIDLSSWVLGWSETDKARVASSLIAQARARAGGNAPIDAILERASAGDAYAWLDLIACHDLIWNRPEDPAFEVITEAALAAGADRLPIAQLRLLASLLSYSSAGIAFCEEQPARSIGVRSLCRKLFETLPMQYHSLFHSPGFGANASNKIRARPSPSAPSLAVLKRVPEAGADKDIAAMVTSYGCLVEPVALAEAPDPDWLAETLRTEFPWLDQVIDEVHGNLVLRRRLGRIDFVVPPLLIVGPSGVGKTRFARRLAALSGDLPFGQINAAGSIDNRVLAGTARGWGSAQPCLPLVLMHRARKANPLILVDEIDKAGGSDRNGRITNTLLLMTEPSSSRSYPDECLLVEADLSHVTWLFLANDENKVPPLLRGRCTVVTAGMPKPEHFDVILQGCLQDIASEHGVDVQNLPPIEALSVEAMRQGFARGKLQARQMARLVRKTLIASAKSETPGKPTHH